MPGSRREVVALETVGFTAMADGTAEDYALVARYEQAEMEEFADRVLGWLRGMDEPGVYPVTRFEHSLQSATRAHRAGEDEEFVVCALLHDIGDVLGPGNHSEVAAALLRPYVSERNYWIVKHHGVFQGYYYFHHIGGDRDAREMYREHPYYQATAEFCEKYDQNCFDPEYRSEPLEFFEPMVRRVLAAERVPSPASVNRSR